MLSVNVPRLPHRTPSSLLAHLSHVRLALFLTCVRHAPRLRSYPPRSSLFGYKCQSLIVTSVIAGSAASRMEESIDVEKLRLHFLQVLRSRRSTEVPLSVELAKPVANPLYQDATPPLFSEAMECCPKADIDGFRDLLREENLYLITEAGDQGRLPVLILSMKESNPQRRPAVVFLHSTHKCKEWLRPLLEAYASRGYIAIAIDSRYHGERASSKTTYRDALISSWKKGDSMPFIFDTVWDLIKLADYLTQREDIDPARIGITGESLGGWLNEVLKGWDIRNDDLTCKLMSALLKTLKTCLVKKKKTVLKNSENAGMHAWYGAVADTRYAVVAPIIGVQGFRWAIENDKWHGRVDSIKPVFEEARIDLGKNEIDKEVVEKVWDRIAPGLASHFDLHHTILAIAPRPLLIVNGAEDPRCPLPGLKIPESRACKVYEEAHCLDKFKLIAQPGIGHQMTPLMVKEACDWLDRFLKQ